MLVAQFGNVANTVSYNPLIKGFHTRPDLYDAPKGSQTGAGGQSATDFFWRRVV